MKLFMENARKLIQCFKSDRNETRERFIFYRIVSPYDAENDIYTIQCINSNLAFQATTTEIVFNYQLLSGLNPADICHVGLQYADLSDQQPLSSKNSKKSAVRVPHESRYGKFKILYIDREKNICFNYS